MGSNPINFNDPTGHEPKYGEGACYEINCKNANGTTPSLGNGKGGGRGDNCDLDCKFEEFDTLERVKEDDMISIGVPVPYMYDSLSPAEHQLLLRKNKLGPYTFNPALDGQLALTMWMIQQQSFATSDSVVGGNRLNSPQDAFRHAYWNALLVREFGPEFADAFTTAHETGYSPRDDNDQMSFMDLHNNQIGINIAVANPTMTDQQIQEAILDALTAGELIVWDGKDFYYSDQCPSC